MEKSRAPSSDDRSPDQVKTSRHKNPRSWSMPSPEKGQHRASYGLFFYPIEEKSQFSHRQRDLRPLRGQQCASL